MLTKDDILNCRDITIKPVSVPEWGGGLHVKTITGKDRIELVRASKAGQMRIEWLLARALCDDQGTRIFDDKDVEALGQRNTVVLERLGQEAMRVSGLLPEAVEEAAKN